VQESNRKILVSQLQTWKVHSWRCTAALLPICSGQRNGNISSSDYGGVGCCHVRFQFSIIKELSNESISGTQLIDVDASHRYSLPRADCVFARTP